MHVDFSACSTKIPLIFRHSSNKKFVHTTPHYKEVSNLRKAQKLCMEECTHFPFLFIDSECSNELPSEEFLAMFYILLTTTKVSAMSE